MVSAVCMYESSWFFPLLLLWEFLVAGCDLLFVLLVEIFKVGVHPIVPLLPFSSNNLKKIYIMFEKDFRVYNLLKCLGV